MITFGLGILSSTPSVWKFVKDISILLLWGLALIFFISLLIVLLLYVIGSAVANFFSTDSGQVADTLTREDFHNSNSWVDRQSERTDRRIGHIDSGSTRNKTNTTYSFDPYSPDNDADIEDMLEDIEREGDNWKK